MFRVQNTLLADSVATAVFACDLPQCKGACCVVGDAGAPLAQKEKSIVAKAWSLLKEELPEKNKKWVEKVGLVSHNKDGGLEINCIEGKECVFVQFGDDNVAYCSIQKAFYEGRFNWEKPISCHLFPLRINRYFDMDFISFEYVPALCSAACERGKKEKILLSHFLKEPLIRRYGEAWYAEFFEACEEVRNRGGR